MQQKEEGEEESGVQKREKYQLYIHQIIAIIGMWRPAKRQRPDTNNRMADQKCTPKR